MKRWLSEHTPIYFGTPLDPIIVGVLCAFGYLVVAGIFWVLR